MRCTYEIETDTSASGKKSKQEDIDEYKKKHGTVEYPDGHKEDYNFAQLEEKYNDLKATSAPSSARNWAKCSSRSARPAPRCQPVPHRPHGGSAPDQIDGLKKKTAEWDPKIVQINVAEANIVDRCESCHMGTREPLKITPVGMMAKGEKKPDEYARAFVSHPEPELLKIHDPDKFGCSPCHQGNGRATTSIEKAHGNYEHWLWPLFPKQNVEAGCQTCHAADMVLVSGDVQWKVINEGKDLFRQRGCMGCHRYEGYDQEPEDLNSVSQQIKQFEGTEERQPQAGGLPDEAGRRCRQQRRSQSAERKGRRAGVANSKLDGRIQQLDFQSHSLMQDMKKIGPNLKDIRLKLNKNWIPVWLKKPTDFRPTTKMPNFRLNDDQIQVDLGIPLAVGVHRCPCPSKSPAMPNTARNSSKPAAAWPATPSAKAIRSRAALSPRT